jgi:hypothetical protein
VKKLILILAAFTFIIGCSKPAPKKYGILFSHTGAFDASAINDVLQSDGQLPQLYAGATDVLQFPGLAIINSSVVDAMTLATPLVGSQQSGGQDGMIVNIIDNGGHAHTVTTASNKIINSKHILTFNGTIGSNITIIAFNGVWYILGTANGVTVS